MKNVGGDICMSKITFNYYNIFILEHSFAKLLNFSHFHKSSRQLFPLSPITNDKNRRQFHKTISLENVLLSFPCSLYTQILYVCIPPQTYVTMDDFGSPVNSPLVYLLLNL